MTEHSTPAIRHAIAADAGLLAELGARTFSEAFAADERNRPEDMAAYMASAFTREQQAAELADPLSIFFIAEIDGVAVGYAKLFPGGEAEGRIRSEKPIELVRLYVSQEWHGRGVGEALMRACIDEARRGDYRTLWLGVWEHNARALAFYRKWNFRDVGRHIFQLGTDAQTDVLMQRTI